MTDQLKDALMIELAYCHHNDLTISETTARVMAIITRKHNYWSAGEPDCPREIKASNGELWKLRCKVCGQDNPRSPICIPGEPA